MEENKKIIKPPKWLTINLYILFIFTIYKSVILLMNAPIYQNDSLEDMHSYLAFYTSLCIDVAMYSYTIVGICRALLCKADSIAMLKLATLYLFFQTLFSGLNYFYGWQVLTALSVTLWFIPWMFYLYKSKSLKLYVPERKKGKYVILGILLYVACFVMYGAIAFEKIRRENNSKRQDVKNINITEHEICDGLIVFSPLAGWEKDTIIINEDKTKMFFYDNKEDSARITINGSRTSDEDIIEEIRNRLDYYQIVSAISKRLYKDLEKINKTNYALDTLSQGVLYADSYEVFTKKDTTNWSIGVYVSKESLKYCIVSIVGEKEHLATVKEFCRGVDFNLKQRLTKHE